VRKKKKKNRNEKEKINRRKDIRKEIKQTKDTMEGQN
jgi:hypothetical protein